MVPAKQPVCPGPHKRQWVSLTAREADPLTASPTVAGKPPCPACPHLAPPLRPLSLSQDHLQHCSFQAVPCPNESCREAMLRKDVKEHLSAYCRFREEKCFYCKRDVVVTNLQVRAGTVGGRTAQMEPRVALLLNLIGGEGSSGWGHGSVNRVSVQHAESAMTEPEHSITQAWWLAPSSQHLEMAHTPIPALGDAWGTSSSPLPS